MKKALALLIGQLVLSLTLFFPRTIFAQTPTPIINVDVELMCTVNGDRGINTAIGCIPIYESSALIGFILKWAIGIGGGIAFILILVAGFQIMTSQGDPQKLQAGKELLTSAIVGLLLIIFSVFILEVIGVDILGIPGFGG